MLQKRNGPKWCRETLQNAALRLDDAERGNKIYVRAYPGGTKHMVVVRPDGSVESQKPFAGRLITQFPDLKEGRRGNLTIEWVRPGTGNGQSQGNPAPTSTGSTVPVPRQSTFQNNNTTPSSGVNRLPAGNDDVSAFTAKPGPEAPPPRHLAWETNFLPDPQIGMLLRQVGKEFPRDNVAPTLIKAKGSIVEIGDKVTKVVQGWPTTVTAKDGSVIRLAHYTRTEKEHVTHMISHNKEFHFNTLKAEWVPMVPATLENAAVRLKNNANNNRLYVRAYRDGRKHVVIVTPDGQVVGQHAFTGSLETQFPYTDDSIDGYQIEWVRPLPPPPPPPHR